MKFNPTDFPEDLLLETWGSVLKSPPREGTIELWEASLKRSESFLRLDGRIIWSSERRVCGGCLGVLRRRRPWQAAKSDGEEQTS